MADELKAMAEVAKKNSEGLASLKKSVDGIVDKLSKTPAPGAHPHQVFGTPWARTGEDPLSSRGFSFLKMIGVLNGSIGPEEAKTELDVHNRLHNVFHKDLGNGTNGYAYGGNGHTGEHRFLAPLSTGRSAEPMDTLRARKQSPAQPSGDRASANPSDNGKLSCKQRIAHDLIGMQHSPFAIVGLAEIIHVQEALRP